MLYMDRVVELWVRNAQIINAFVNKINISSNSTFYFGETKYAASKSIYNCI